MGTGETHTSNGPDPHPRLDPPLHNTTHHLAHHPLPTERGTHHVPEIPDLFPRRPGQHLPFGRRGRHALFVGVTGVCMRRKVEIPHERAGLDVPHVRERRAGHGCACWGADGSVGCEGGRGENGLELVDEGALFGNVIG